MSTKHPYGRCDAAITDCEHCLNRADINETEWLDSTTAIVTWYYRYDELMRTCEVVCEPEGADPSVGIMSAYVTADGECPQSILDKVAEECAEKLCEGADEGPEYDKYGYLDAVECDRDYPEDDNY